MIAPFNKIILPPQKKNNPVSEFSSKHNRVDYIDVAKGIGIILVVFAHMNYINPPQDYIYSFHMPLFFIISGMLYNPLRYSSFKQFFLKRVKTLIIPYLFFSVLSLLFICIPITLYDGGLSKDNLSTIFNYFIQIFIANNSQTVYNTPLWFVPCLFAVECICFFLLKIKNRIVLLSVTGIIVFLGWLSQSDVIHIDLSVIPWNLGIALFAVGFYVIGNISFKAIRLFLSSETIKKKIILLVTAFVFASIIFFISKYTGHFSMGSRMLRNGALFYVTGIIGSVSVLSFSSLISKCKFLIFCGKNSFYIMATHKMIESVICIGIKLFISDSYIYTGYVWKDSLYMFVSVLLLSILFSYIYGTIKNKLLRRYYNGRITRNT